MISLKLKYLPFIAVSLSALLACHNDFPESHNMDKPLESTIPPRRTEEASVCNPTDFKPRKIYFEDRKSIRREFQRVIRYDCKSLIKSDSIETMVPPRGGDLSITPRVVNLNPHPNFKGQWKILNRQRCGGSSTYRFNDPDRLEAILYIDAAPGLFSFQVAPGDNLIDYDFYACEKLDEIGDCLEKAFHESGSVLLHIDYQEYTRPEVLEVKPSDQECKNSAEST